MEKFSELLLGLYQASPGLPTKEFQLHALEQIKRHIAFDAASWLMATELTDGRQYVHDVYFRGVPEDSAQLLNLTVQDNIIARTCARSPGTCFYFSAEDLRGHRQTAVLARHMGITELICVAWRAQVPQLMTSIGLSRRDPTVSFSEEDRLLLQYLAPHLADMLQANRVAQLAAIRARDSETRSAMAVIDELGMLLAAEPGFATHLRAGWPEWQGPYLPRILLEAVAAKQKQFLGKEVLVRFDQVRDSTLVTISRRAASDALTARERSVAEGFAGGESYKEVARRLTLSPSTVRHHLRAIYRKLGVADKGALSRLMSDSSGAKSFHAADFADERRHLKSSAF